ncbi:hypothetical protein RAS12_20485 [Achromobacter seleniivolatilans]|uniref:Pilus assembly protein n=1 Tax=Achromobacter seleniivolatilans TaxID=3047478 RepID=A0ABY9LWT3_9BURK|nr:hypothetical protein [Achromobacter sp. R39]WMD18987.1 hypothetical protein RAS12_20485 [Achromobacter sp. R39]
MLPRPFRRAVPAASSRRRQRGALAVEAAIALPILLGVGMIGADMQRIHSERIRVENAAGAMALNLAAQPKLTAGGVDALAELAMQGHTNMQQLIILNVLQSGRIAWALQRGGARALCEAPAAGGRYTGTLPEDRPDTGQSNVDNSTMSMIVVKACRDTTDISLWAGIPLPEVLETTGIFRATSRTITLDEALRAESIATGLAYSEP